MDADWLNKTFDLVGMHVTAIAAGVAPAQGASLPAPSAITMGGIVPAVSVQRVADTDYKAHVYLPLLDQTQAAWVDVDVPMQVLETALDIRERIFLWGAIAGLCLLGLLAIAIRILLRENRMRLKAEEAERLREKSETEHLRRMTGMLPGIMYECEFAPDGNMEITFMNEAVREIFGLEPARLRANAREFSEHIHPDDRERIRAKIREHLQNPRAVGRGISLHLSPTSERAGSRVRELSPAARATATSSGMPSSPTSPRESCRKRRISKARRASVR